MFYREAEVELITGKMLLQHVSDAMYKKGNRTPEEANMPLKRKPYRPLSNLNFEATRQIDSGRHKEWSKYVIGVAI